MKKTLLAVAFAFAIAPMAHAEFLAINTGTYLNVNAESGDQSRASTTLDAQGNAQNDDSNDRKDRQDQNERVTANGGASLLLHSDDDDVSEMSSRDKAAFLLTVKQHAQLQSGQDLHNFAKGVLVADANVKTVKADDSHVEVKYKMPAKFLGVFKTDLDARADVSFDEKTKAKTPKEVDVRFPWYRMFYSLEDSVKADILETAIEASVKSGTTANASTTANVSARNGQVIEIISRILKNIRIQVEAQSAVSAN